MSITSSNTQKREKKKEDSSTYDKSRKKKEESSLFEKDKSKKKSEASRQKSTKNPSKNSTKTEKQAERKCSTNKPTSRDSKETPVERSPSLIKDYEIHEILGEGVYSIVYRVTKKDTPQKPYACKRYKINEQTKTWVDRYLTRELDIALRVRHPKIIRAYEAFYFKDEAFLIQEFAPLGTVRTYLRNLSENDYLDESVIRDWFSDMLSAVAYLHGKEIAHRDIKTDNFLFSQQLTPLLSDFSFACYTPSPMVQFDCWAWTQCGTPFYLAPEVHTLKLGDKYNAKKADVYSMGICLFEMFNKENPFRLRAVYREDFIQLQMKKDYFPVNDLVKMSAESLKLVDLMLEPQPQKRISINRALLDDWFKPPVRSKTSKESRSNSTEEKYHKQAWHNEPLANNHEENSIDINHSASITDQQSDEASLDDR